MAWAIIALILEKIGQAVGKVWDETKNLVKWFIDVMPPMMRFFFFLYILLFLASVIVPAFIGVGASCDSKGNVYKINPITLWFDQERVDTLAKQCTGNLRNQTVFGSTVDVTNPLSAPPLTWWAGVFSYWKDIGMNWFNAFDYWKAVQSQNATKIVEIQDQYKICALLRDNPQNTTVTRDVALQLYGTPIVQKDYKNVIHIGCVTEKDGSQSQTLKFYDVDLFNFEMWLLLGIAMFIVPLALNWYKVILGRGNK